ncbi:uncharacterized protein LOC129594919 [Paramacrobiotus metropolitanus]|uniref:uncharacterized protein LOC129594919 n=1 Tax=Paramacrobiotus metropolitanus TaxID=2943436 RepID=UPI0024460E65|nr:uncharacterized protein LOC129594919 [Paramacrobiotus metropolitanus]
MLMRAANTEGEEYQEVIIGSVENIRHWTDNAKAMFVQNILEKSFESRLRDRAKYVEFVCGLARERLFSPEVLADGVGEIVAVTENIVAEVPDMYTVVVDILGSLLADKILDVAAVVIALNRSPVHTPKYYAALRQWLDAHLSAQEKEELVSRQPSVGWAMLGQPGCSVDGAAMEGVGSE